MIENTAQSKLLAGMAETAAPNTIATAAVITPGARVYLRAGLTITSVAKLVGVFAIIALARPTALAETWTNAAGHRIDAELKDVAGQTVFFRTPNGKDLHLPLKSLSEADRRRVLERTGKTPVPTAVQQAYQHAGTGLLRARQFRDGGRITPAEFADRCKHLIKLFEKQCAEYAKHAGSDALPTSTRDRLVKQLSAP